MAEVKEIVTENGREIRIYDNGAKQDVLTGQFIAPPESAIFRTSERGRELVNIRYDKAAQAVQEAMDEGTDVPEHLRGSIEGYKRLLVHTVKTYMKSDNIRGMGEAIAKLSKLAGYGDTERQETPPGMMLIPEEEYRKYLEVTRIVGDILRKIKNRDTVDGEIGEG